jgi:hypothetical protein
MKTSLRYGLSKAVQCLVHIQIFQQPKLEIYVEEVNILPDSPFPASPPPPLYVRQKGKAWPHSYLQKEKVRSLPEHKALFRMYVSIFLQTILL